MKRWLVLIFLAVVILGVGLWYRHELKIVESEAITAWEEDHKADCAIVLTGGPGRVREGFDLLEQGQVHKLIISGVHPRATMREIFPQMPFYSRVRQEDVVLERRSATTFGNAQQTLPLVEALRCRSVVLVTSHLHMHRSFKTFRQAYPNEIVIFTRAISSGSIPAKWWDTKVEAAKSVFYSVWAY